MILAQSGSTPLGLLIAADIFAFSTVIYVGFAMGFVIGIQLWNTSLLPILYATLGIWGGLGVTLMVLLPAGQTTAVADVEHWSKIFLLVYVFILFIYLLTIRYQGSAGKTSAKLIVAGKWAPLFWVVVVGLGMAVPVGAVLSSWLGGVKIPVLFLYFMIICELVGDLSLRYCLLSCGLYSPAIPSVSYA